MLSSLLFLTALALPIAAAPVVPRAPVPNGPVITTTSGQYFGGPATQPGVTSFLGIPFADPPLGNLRFRAPRPLSNVSTDARPALQFGDACPQFASPDVPVPVPISEDCLTLNVWRPDTVKAGDRLPILFWIHGGGFKSGVSASWDMAIMTLESINMTRPMIVVSTNYRLNVFGFLQSDELPVGDLSAGLLDQRLAMKWAYDNAAALGGDPSKITIFGESAGAISVSMHVTYAPEQNRYFRAAICDSGSPTSHTTPPVPLYDQPGLPFGLLQTFSNCVNLECVRNLPYATLMQAMASVNTVYPNQLSAWGPSLKAGSYIPERPSVRVQSGRFNHIPIITGTNYDEGTILSLNFASAAVAATGQPGQASDEYLKYFMTTSAVLDVDAIQPSVYDRIAQLYPEDPTVGSPFGTGDETFGLSAVYKRMSAWKGDLHYQAPRRLFTQHTASLQPTYVFEFTGPFNSSATPSLGTYHYSELFILLGFGRVDMLPPTEAAATLALGKRWRRHYINFVHDLNPGDDWPRYLGRGGEVKQFNKYNNTIMSDTWRSEQIDFLNSQAALDTFFT